MENLENRIPISTQKNEQTSGPNRPRGSRTNKKKLYGQEQKELAWEWSAHISPSVQDIH